jgi:Xaa-Pro aminopeptidase
MMTTKHQRIASLLEDRGLDGLIIQQIANFAWATDGAASYINSASTNGVGTLLITKDSRYLIADNIEAPRFEKEENLKAQGWEFHLHQWDQKSAALDKLTKDLKLGADGFYPGAVDLSGELSIVRSYLDADEQAKFRSLSSLCAQAMDEAIRATKPGMTEHEIAAALAAASTKRGVLPTVILIATDERIFNYRHPLPTNKPLKKYAMLILCGRQHGLVSSLTRLIHFGVLPTEIQQKMEMVAYVDAAMIAATRPGRNVRDVFQVTKDAYAKVGFAGEWQLHHQGGPAGYDPREIIVTDAADVPIGIGQVYAWNPSITGSKSEDTILVGEQGNQIITTIPDWPTIPVEIDGQVIKRPAILVVE